MVQRPENIIEGKEIPKVLQAHIEKLCVGFRSFWAIVSAVMVVVAMLQGFLSVVTVRARVLWWEQQGWCKCQSWSQEGWQVVKQPAKPLGAQFCPVMSRGENRSCSGTRGWEKRKAARCKESQPHQEPGRTKRLRLSQEECWLSPSSWAQPKGNPFHTMQADVLIKLVSIHT